MAVTAQAQGFYGTVVIGGVRYSVRSNPQFRANRNIDVTPNIGTGYPYLYAEGVITPTFTCSIVPRDVVTTTGLSGRGNPFTYRLLQSIFSRVTTVAPAAPTWESVCLDTIATPLTSTAAYAATYNDLLTGGTGGLPSAGIVFFDGVTCTFMGGVKLDTIRISFAKGQDIGFDCTFVGTWARQFNPSSGEMAALMATNSDCNQVMRFNNVGIEDPASGTNPFADKVFGMTLTYSNNHTPNMGLDGTVYPIAQNAGMPSAGVSLTLQGLDSVPGDINAVLTEKGIAFTVYGSWDNDAVSWLNKPRATFTIPNLVVYNPYDRSGTLGRVLRNYSYTALGSCNTPNATAGSPIGITLANGWEA